MFLHHANETNIFISMIGQINLINSIFCLNYCEKCDSNLRLKGGLRGWDIG